LDHGHLPADFPKLTRAEWYLITPIVAIRKLTVNHVSGHAQSFGHHTLVYNNLEIVKKLPRR
jgi:hypothetical protein